MDSVNLMAPAGYGARQANKKRRSQALEKKKRPLRPGARQIPLPWTQTNPRFEPAPAAHTRQIVANHIF
jgi:hypothetical protein